MYVSRPTEEGVKHTLIRRDHDVVASFCHQRRDHDVEGMFDTRWRSGQREKYIMTKRVVDWFLPPSEGFVSHLLAIIPGLKEGEYYFHFVLL